MEPADVLKIYESLMMEYDKLLRIILNIVEDDNFKQIKDKIFIIASETAPKCVSVDIEPSSQAKIMAASFQASNIARQQLEEVKDSEDYKKRFREVYDAALRIELYRQFFVQGQTISALKSKFKKENPNAKADLESLMNFLFKDISKNINSEFSKFNQVQGSTELINSMRISLDGLLKKLGNDIKGNLKKGYSDIAKINSIQEAVQDFQIEASQLIRGYQFKTESDESWAPFLKNMLMLLTVIGTIPALISLATKAATGHYAFFDRTVIRETPKENLSPEDLLLGM